MRWPLHVEVFAVDESSNQKLPSLPGFRQTRTKCRHTTAADQGESTSGRVLSDELLVVLQAGMDCVELEVSLSRYTACVLRNRVAVVCG